jgi:predicted ATPase
MIERVTGNKSLSVSIRQDIIERTDGIPLFVEEMTKAVLEAQGEGAAESALASVPSPSIGLPASLHASLMARLDRLGPAKEVAQIGAAVGREFSHVALAINRENDLIAPPTGAEANPSAKTPIKALATSSPTLSTASARSGRRVSDF